MKSLMAAESDGLLGVMPGNGEDQPIDLSRAPRKATRIMPPLIPISVLRANYHQRRFLTNRNLHHYQNNQREGSPVNPQGKTENGNHAEDEEVWQNEISAKRSRHENDAREEPGNWHPRLDRSRSVPQLTPLPLALQRHKSLSESRIPSAAAAAAAAAVAAAEAATVDRAASNEDVRHAIPSRPLPASTPRAEADETTIKTPWIFLDYYNEMVHRFHAQELLRQFALQHQRDSQDDQGQETTQNLTAKATMRPEDNNDLRRRQARPLTGKHVRPGTGASPATLLSLRRKIQARQQQHEAK